MMQALLDRAAAWTAGNGPEADIVVCTRGRLVRNLIDFPFPWRCSDDERQAIEDRVQHALDRAHLSTTGQYIPLVHAEQRELRFLLERHLISDDMTRADGPRGVYVSDDQNLCIMVNGLHHLQIQVMASGLQAQEVWTRLNALDDQLAKSLDYAFDSQLGYLGAELSNLGTGLHLSALLHLPALGLANRVRPLAQALRDQWHLLEGVFGGAGDVRGDLNWLSNQSTLGRSEDETVFHLNHLVEGLVAQERASRAALQDDSPRGLEDRVGRALGVARGARLLDFNEALALLSALRLGQGCGLLEGYSLQQFNELLQSAQRTHLEFRKGHDCDELTLSAERADLFQSIFAAN